MKLILICLGLSVAFSSAALSYPRAVVIETPMLVAALPQCVLINKGVHATVTDLVGPQIDRGPVAGGGSLTWVVVCDGRAWYQEFK
jgi:hypothetical protein